MELYASTDNGVIIHGHCNRITYSPRANYFATKEYITTGDCSKISEMSTKMTKNDGKLILKLHGEFIGAEDFKNALFKYKELYHATR